MSEEVNVPAGPPEGTPPPQFEQPVVDDGSEDEEGLAEALDTAAAADAAEALAEDEAEGESSTAYEAPGIHHQRPLEFNQGT